MAAGLITPEELRRIVEDKEMEKAREALEKQRARILNFPGGMPGDVGIFVRW